MYKLHGKLNWFLLSGHFRELKIREILLKFFRSSSLYVQQGNCKRIFYSCLPIVTLHAFQVVAHGNCKPISVLMIHDCRLSRCMLFKLSDMGIVSPPVYWWLLIVALHAFQVVAHMSRQVEIWRWTTKASFLTTQNTSQNISIQGQIKNSNQYHLENYSFQKYRTIFFQPFSAVCVKYCNYDK